MRQHLDQQVASDPKLNRHLEKIATEVKRSNETINDLLELARNRPLEARPTRVADLLASAVAAAHLPVTVEVDIQVADAFTAALDADQIARVFTNLLINASQAMGGIGKIWLEAEQRQNQTRIRMRDSGPGVPTEVRHRIFEALFTTKARGSGLGLALCRRIAEAHGGSIELEPSAHGASFLLTLPVKAAGAVPA
jgi:signal transduction histidine kinase